VRSYNFCMVITTMVVSDNVQLVTWKADEDNVHICYTRTRILTTRLNDKTIRDFDCSLDAAAWIVRAETACSQ
jgi:hypothetical protein